MKHTAPTSSPQSKTSSQPFFGRPAGSALASEQAEPAFFGPAPFVQAKMTIGAPDDPYEREADAVAEQVVQRMAASPSEKEQIQPKIQRLPINVQRACAECEQEEKLQKNEEKAEEPEGGIQRKPIFESAGDDENLAGIQPGGAVIQRKCAECEKEEAIQRKPAGGGEMAASPDVASRISASKGGGSPLPESVQTSMGGALGADLSGVRVHTNSQAAQLNRDLSAQAFTHGSDVYFGAGKFQPGTAAGDRLLAHELVHVGQQGGGIHRQAAREGIGSTPTLNAGATCPNTYNSDEIHRSQGARGILNTDVTLNGSGEIFISDFGVNSSYVKPSLRRVSCPEIALHKPKL